MNRWAEKPLGDVCKIIGGGTPSKDRSEYFNGNIPWATVRDLKSDLITETEFKITKEAVANSATHVIPRGNVIIATRVGLGKVNILGEDTAINQDLKAIIPINAKILSVSFLYWWFKFISPRIIAEGTGATVQGVKLTFINSLLIPLPPLPEQQRIVRILDEAFAGIAVARANAEKNLQNAREVFESYLNEVFTQRGEGWVEKALGDFCTFENGDRGTNYPSRSLRTASGIPFINAGHLTDEGISFDNMNYISRERFDLLGAGKIRPGDILFCLRGSLGKFASVGNLSEGAIASSLVIVRTNPSVLNGYLLGYFRSNLCVNMIKKYSNGTAQPNLSANSLSRFLIPIPKLSEQQTIIERLNELSIEIKRMEAIYQQKLIAIDELKQSLLHQAFTGLL